jgi:hypothetical protein
LIGASFDQRRSRPLKQPAPPDRRQRPLPQERPKPGSEDPKAPANVRAILDSPSYRRADRDLDFLAREDLRGLRLMLDYRKPQTLLGERDVAHTIVVFGSTRIPEPAAARRRVAAARDALAGSPDDPERRSRLGIARRIHA